MIRTGQFAGIQYLGVAGISEECVEAVQRLLQYNDDVTCARLLTHNREHCLLLTINEYDRIAVKSGFSSGYRGEGPQALARTLQLLLERDIEVEEIEIDRFILERTDSSTLTQNDIIKIDSAPPVRPMRIYDYIYDAIGTASKEGMYWNRFPPTIPFAIIDSRIADLALRFFDNPNDTLLQGFRRLEDTVRQRTNSHEHGAKLFSQAFQGEASKLAWSDVQQSEVSGRVSLFTGAYMAHRNPRAHREISDDVSKLLSEFLLLNHLFKLEAEAKSTGK